VEIAGSVALVTGANRGLGAAFCRALLEAGASKVYAGARHPANVGIAGVVPVRLDITSSADIVAAAAACTDVTLLINNAGILNGTRALAENAAEAGQREFATNVFGLLNVTRAFAPILASNGGGGLINVLSVLSWLSSPGAALYCASKAASWSLTNAIRLELQAQHTHVLALHVGLMETEMAANLKGSKSSPDDVAAQALEGLRAGAFEVLADDSSRRVKRGLSAELSALYPSLLPKVGV
jgi:NAD(P)-dependent dehydrogenase (short-subunit alcohol dehydrogenase family)